MRKLLLLLSIVTLTFATQLTFKPVKLHTFELQGFSSKIVFKNKIERNEQVAKLWEKIFSASFIDLSKSKDGNLYVVYRNYKPNSFECFIGIKAKNKIESFERTLVASSSYNKASISYKKNMDMDQVWENIQKAKIKRDFKTDIERHKLKDIIKGEYNIDIYLSSK